MTRGQARRDALIALCPRGGITVDVGADHGLVAEALGAIATERMPHRAAPRAVPWVVCDGLAAFRRVDVAVIAGMGARSIARILARGPRPGVAVLHAQDDPGALRRWLAANGWRIDAEALAPEGRGYAEIVRALPGAELAPDVELDLGPRLIEGRDPHARDHFARVERRLRAVADRVREADPERHERILERLDRLDRLTWRAGPRTAP